MASSKNETPVKPSGQTLVRQDAVFSEGAALDHTVNHTVDHTVDHTAVPSPDAVFSEGA